MTRFSFILMMLEHIMRKRTEARQQDACRKRVIDGSSPLRTLLPEYENPNSRLHVLTPDVFRGLLVNRFLNEIVAQTCERCYELCATVVVRYHTIDHPASVPRPVRLCSNCSTYLGRNLIVEYKDIKVGLGDCEPPPNWEAPIYCSECKRHPHRINEFADPYLSKKSDENLVFLVPPAIVCARFPLKPAVMCQACIHQCHYYNRRYTFEIKNFADCLFAHSQPNYGCLFCYIRTGN